ncbi:fasciclin domain-containing protein [Variovorax sp. OV329]|uniref:fasciclin domain-containing protein n=1 Tax=Variovorax sp. OV329 TaxID=1882825 RepID=UPI0008DF9A48|nr:fasciclin domain-containing protein [Variovorax sp. OV329]SFM62135.1 Uncaracterized surface protein containing fasciclin (FAS1) repeats [Variovorax sp. OV329]
MQSIILKRRQLIKSAAALGGVLVLQACGGGGNDTNLSDRKNLMELAESKQELSVFVEAVNAAGLRETLQAAGSNTVFAPNNDAFTALLGELGTTKDALFANKPLLTAVLKFHILGKVMSRDTIPEGKAIEPIGGGFFKIDGLNNVYTFTDGRNRNGKVVSFDSLSLNGPLHVLDRVMLPADKNITQTVQSRADLATLTLALAATGAGDTLQGSGPFTLLAPNNSAFAALAVELGVTQAALLADTAQLRNILNYHVLQSRKLRKEIDNDSALGTLQGGSVRINSSNQVTDARGRISTVTTIDIISSNGVIHVVDKVLLPA